MIRQPSDLPTNFFFAIASLPNKITLDVFNSIIATFAYLHYALASQFQVARLS